MHAIRAAASHHPRGAAPLSFVTTATDQNIPLMDVTVNGSTRNVDASSADVATLIRLLGLEGKRIAVERNGEIVPKSRYAETRVVAGDKLEIVAAVGGG